MSLNIAEIANEVSNSKLNNLMLQTMDTVNGSATFTDRMTNADVELNVKHGTVKVLVTTKMTTSIVKEFMSVPEFIEWYNTVGKEIYNNMLNDDNVAYIDDIRKSYIVNNDEIENLELYNIAMALLTTYIGSKITNSSKNLYEFEYGHNTIFLQYDTKDQKYHVKFIRNKFSYAEITFTGIKSFCRIFQHSIDPKLMSINDMALEFAKRIQNLTVVKLDTKRALLSDGSTNVYRVFKFTNHWVCEVITMKSKHTIKFKDLDTCFDALDEKGLM